MSLSDVKDLVFFSPSYRVRMHKIMHISTFWCIKMECDQVSKLRNWIRDKLWQNVSVR